MRYLFGFMCVLALRIMPMVGCGDTTGDGGSGGSAGTGGMGGGCGTGGIDMPADACLDDSDVIRENLVELRVCYGRCFLEQEGASCVSPCVSEIGVSQNCAACYGLRAECVLDGCEDFRVCFLEESIECTDDFKECTGGIPCGGVSCRSDENECTDAVCSSPDGICQYPPVEDDTACDHGIGSCQAGECVDAMKCEAVDCDDGDACTDDTCDPTDGTCSSVPRCVDNSECTVDTCDPADGMCSHTPLPDGTFCGGILCCSACQSGVCVPI